MNLYKEILLNFLESEESDAVFPNMEKEFS